MRGIELEILGFITNILNTIKLHMIEIITFILVVVTGIYALFTYKILQANNKVIKEMQAQREASFRPYILVAAIPHPFVRTFHLIIRNTGLGVASNLKLHIDKDFYQRGQKSDENNLRLQWAFNNRIDHFVPSAEIIYELADDWVLFSDNANEDVQPKRFTITTEYEYQGNVYKENTVIDLEVYLNNMISNDPIAGALNSINTTLQSFSPNSFESRIAKQRDSKNKTSDSQDKT